MEIKVKPIGKTQYIINGYIVAAQNYREALENYISVHCGGAKTIFPEKGANFAQ